MPVVHCMSMTAAVQLRCWISVSLTIWNEVSIDAWLSLNAGLFCHNWDIIASALQYSREAGVVRYHSLSSRNVISVLCSLPSYSHTPAWPFTWLQRRVDGYRWSYVEGRQACVYLCMRVYMYVCTCVTLCVCVHSIDACRMCELVCCACIVTCLR